MKKPPTNFEDFFKYINNKKLEYFIRLAKKLCLQYHKVWFSQTQQTMEQELKELEKQIENFNKKFQQIKYYLSTNIKREYLERVSKYDWEAWTLKEIRKRYENQ